MIIVVEFERYVAGAHILGIVISELGHAQGPNVVNLFSIDKCTKISFHCAILSLSLAIRLQIECSKQILLNAEKII